MASLESTSGMRNLSAFLLLCAFPAMKKRRCRTCIASQDMTPTLLGILGVSIPSTVEGEDCSSYLLTEKEDLEKASYLCACPGRDIFLKNFARAGKDPKAFGWRGVRTQDYTYVIELGYDVTPRPARYLYCTAADPQQMHPLALDVPENRRLARQMEDSVIAWDESPERRICRKLAEGVESI